MVQGSRAWSLEFRACGFGQQLRGRVLFPVNAVFIAILTRPP